MKPSLSSLTRLIFFIPSLVCPVGEPSESFRFEESINKMPLSFIENLGLVDGDAAYLVQGMDKALYFDSHGLTLALTEKGRYHTVRLEFLATNPGVEIEGRNRLETRFSVFKGKPKEWKRSIPTYSTLVYQDLWPGIDLVYSGCMGRLKYEFLVRPGADPGQIRLAYRGATNVALMDTGELKVTTPAGVFEDGAPSAYQTFEGERNEVPMRYLLEPSGQEDSFVYGFEVGSYDPKTTLVLDPVLIIYCGFISPGNYDDGLAIALDGQGRAVVAGVTSMYRGLNSGNNPMPGGPGSDDPEYDIWDGFVARVTPNGLGLDYCIVIGGNKYDGCSDIAVDEKGRAYITGDTLSSEATFPVVVGPDLTHRGGQDAFVARISADGSDLDYCGFIGGQLFEYGNGIALDVEYRAYVTGFTESDESSFPVIGGPDLSFNGSRDAFVARVKADGSSLDYCGFVGGSHHDFGYGITADNSGRAYITGQTGSQETSFPVHIGPDLSFNGGLDAFVARVEEDGSSLGYCGYIGGTDEDMGRSIALDQQGLAYITGYTESDETSFPLAVGPDLTHNGKMDAFVARVNTSGTGLDYCGYIGGFYEDLGRGIRLDAWNNPYVVGYTFSTETTFPVAVGPDLTHNGGVDAFVARLKPDGSGLEYCGFVGGMNEDYGFGIAVDDHGHAYITGRTDSDESSFPAVIGPKLKYNGYAAAYVTRIYSPFSSKILYVDDSNASGPWNGTWDHPYRYIQDGINNALGGDTVFVQPGTYGEKIDFKGKSVTVKSLRGASATVIDGNQSGSVVTFNTGEHLESVLDGFTVLNGNGTFDAVSGSNLGGGIYCRYASPRILNNVIIENTVDGSGGGIHCDHSFPSISNNLILHNSAAGRGGGIFCSKSFPLIVNNSLTRNMAGCGGGICCMLSSSLDVCNTILWDNDAPLGPEIGMVNQVKPSTLLIRFSDVKGGAADAYIETGCTLDWGAGMIDSDPLFVDDTRGDHHLIFNSPCRGSGDNAVIPSDLMEDFECDPRIAYGTVDMGADEFYTHLYHTGDARPGKTVEIKLVGLPGTSPVILWVGSGVLGAPVHTMYGDWHLDFPILLTLGLDSIPTPEGVSVLPYAFDPGFPAMEIPMQALIGMKLSNLCVLAVE